jgi:hypothetical protein
MERRLRVIGKVAAADLRRDLERAGDHGWTKMHRQIPGVWQWVDNARKAEVDPVPAALDEVPRVATKADAKADLEAGRRVVHVTEIVIVIVIVIVVDEEMSRGVPNVIGVATAEKIRAPVEEKTTEVVVAWRLFSQPFLCHRRPNLLRVKLRRSRC